MRGATLLGQLFSPSIPPPGFAALEHATAELKVMRVLISDEKHVNHLIHPDRPKAKTFRLSFDMFLAAEFLEVQIGGFLGIEHEKKGEPVAELALLLTFSRR